MSVGGAGAAFASTDPVEPVLETAVEPAVEPAAEPIVEPVAEPEPEPAPAVAPAVAPLIAPATRPADPGSSGGGPADNPCDKEPGFAGGTKYNIEDDPDAADEVSSPGSMETEWGSLSWTDQTITVTVDAGWTIDFCIKGGSQEQNTIALDLTGPGVYFYERVQDISHFMWANASFTAPVASASIVTNPRDCFFPTTWNFDTDTIVNASWGEPFVEDGLIKIVATATGGALFAGGLTSVTFTAPFETAGGDDCVAPAIGVTALAAKITCDTDGWFEFGPGLGVSEEDAARLVWTVGPAGYADNDEPGVEHAVSETVTITITVSLDEESEGDFALVDESGNNVVPDPETGDITYTFEFTKPDDCDRGDVVVPDVTKVDECIVDEVIALDLSPAATAVASFTVTASPNVSYVYTVNGGAAIPVVFPDGESTVTISVTPGATVVVTASAADPYSLPEGYEPWQYTFVVSGLCFDFPTAPVTSADVAFIMPDCLGNPGRVTLTNGLGVIWTLNGEVVAGNSSYDVTPGTEIDLTAELEEPSELYPLGFGWNDPEQETDWTQAFPAAADDCLPTLALTGAGAVTNWLGVAAVLMTLAGMGFVLRRHRVEV